MLGGLDKVKVNALKREPLASKGSVSSSYHNDLISYGPAALVIGDADSWAANGARNVRAYSRTSLRNTRETGREQRGRRSLVSEILRQLDTITEMRRARLSAAVGLVPGLIWPILFGGALITIAYTFFFGSQNLGAPTLMTGMLSTIIFSGLLTAIVIDHPFAGVVKVTPHALTQVLEDFGAMPGDH
jgi:Protein of unknown function (DUF4239)